MSCDHINVFFVSKGSASLRSLPSSAAKLRTLEVWHDSLLLLFLFSNYFADFFPISKSPPTLMQSLGGGLCLMSCWGAAGFKLMKGLCLPDSKQR